MSLLQSTIHCLLIVLILITVLIAVKQKAASQPANSPYLLMKVMWISLAVALSLSWFANLVANNFWAENTRGVPGALLFYTGIGLAAILEIPLLAILLLPKNVSKPNH
jgi:hypothetical protein